MLGILKMFFLLLLIDVQDDNQNRPNVRTEHTRMGPPMAVVLRSAPPPLRPAYFCSNVGTTLMSHTANFAVWMLPPRLRNWLVPSQLPTAETVTLIPSTTYQRRQGPPTGSECMAVALIKFLSATALVAVIVLFVFILVYRRAVKIMKWMYTDETDELYNKPLRTKPAEKTNRQKQSGKCVLPAYPENGTYIITNAPAAKPGESFKSLTLTVICLPGYKVLGKETVICDDGLWSDSDPIPKCVRFCKLDNHASVHYQCLVTGSIEGHRTCNAYEPSGTVVKPECNSPNYYSAVTLPYMRCIDGSWNYVAVCAPECGRVTPNGVDLMIGGRPAKRGELPWHVGIYRKNKKPYMQICGGSLISNSLVISAAHCFWDDFIKLLPASEYAVAGGKIYRPWNNRRDVHAQKSDVKEIKIPVRFQGSAANFQDDLAIVILENPFEYNPFVRPICLDFDVSFDRRQLQPENSGKVAGWGLTAENGEPSQILKVVELPYVDITQCITVCPAEFREYITSDKICAGRHGTALCKGDSGGGLAFPESERGTDRYYLRGIVSTAPNNNNLCKSNTFTTFTQLLIHEHFIREHL